MQLKGLVRFFTILLIIYSLYQLSFTWFVRNHEKKLEKQAQSYVDKTHPAAAAKYPANKDSQAIYQEWLNEAYEARLVELKDSTRDVTVSYGITGPISYQKAKGEELNLGLDLQGGMNVTMEVEMSGVLSTLANNSKDPNFTKAIVNADHRKANSDANFVTLFVDEYKKLVPNGRLAALFANSSNTELKATDDDAKVISYLNKQAKAAFDNTSRLITTRIDKFGVAQPNINPDAEKQIISVELPGVQDKERVKKNLQASANLQFWEVYNISEIWPNVQKADELFFAGNGGKVAADSTAAKDSTAVASATTDTSKTAATAKVDTGNLQAQLKDLAKKDAPKANAAATNQEAEAKKHLYGWIGFSVDQQQGRLIDNGMIGQVLTKDTFNIRRILESANVKNQFPADLVWMFGIPEKNRLL
ncbi:preprotein translocase subunit SecD [Niabella hibiscisoli]|uniref:hypothetical protein n=1 Tax=Niabella hibiscisoli TaxID=1825928 RepID=UPI001F0E567E|nr:hypothetical protein [Niabella hibiscisoli]MCH5719132.1 hypothetical protein [Niabella hibiscisoli]